MKKVDRTHKHCKVCNRTLSIDNFYQSKGRDGKYHQVQANCKECDRATSRANSKIRWQKVKDGTLEEKVKHTQFDEVMKDPKNKLTIFQECFGISLFL